MKTPREKYNNDPHYKVLVDQLTSFIHNCQYTPSEIREAVVLACINYEESRVQRHFTQETQNTISRHFREIETIINIEARK